MRVLLLFILLAGLAGGCNRRQAAAAPPPPPLVTVAHPVVQLVTDWDEYSGTLASPATVNVMARVSGFLIDAPFQEGAIVKRGDLLFVLDPASFQADVQSKQADVTKAQTQAQLATREAQRYEQLYKQQSISQEVYENQVATYRQALAQLQSAQAALTTAELNLQWSRVVAPISGRVGRKLVTPGNLVIGGTVQATSLTTIESLDPIYAYFDVNERAVLHYQQLIRQGKLRSARESQMPVFLALANETDFPHAGIIDFINNRIDPGTGTITVRGIFANHDDRMLPGFSATIRVPASGRYEALLVPDAAIGTDQNLRFLLLVTPDRTVERRNVELGGLFGPLRSIVSGLTANDQVIIAGLMHARPGGKVTANPGQIPAAQVQLLPATLPSTEPAEPEVEAATTGPAATMPATLPALPPIVPSTEPATLPAGTRPAGRGAGGSGR